MAVVIGGGSIFLQYKIPQIKGAITSCEPENENFVSVIDFEYVSNWIVVKVKIAGKTRDMILWLSIILK